MKPVFMILWLSAMSISACHAQDPLMTAKFHYTGSDFSIEMNKHVQMHRNWLGGYMGIFLTRKYRRVMDSVCEIGVAMVKFKLSVANGVTEVACSESTNPRLAKIFKDIVIYSSKYWVVKENNYLPNYILPVNYSFKSGCKDSQIKKSDIENEFVFQFDDGTKAENEPVVILRSLHIMSGDGAHD